MVSLASSFCKPKSSFKPTVTLQFQIIFRYMYGGEVSSLRIPDDDIVTHGKCLSINDQVGRHLRDENKIRYKLKLMKV